LPFNFRSTENDHVVGHSSEVRGLAPVPAADCLAAASRPAEPPVELAISAELSDLAGRENFPVALRILPRARRTELMAVYAFARTTDDIGDRAPADRRMRLLDELDADVRRLGDGSPRLPVVAALGGLITTGRVDRQLLRDLIQANRQDQEVTSYRSYEDLAGYCQLSANPVGRIVLQVFGVFSEQRAALSDQICTGLQLAEHWQDVAEDFAAGRVYLPASDMERFGCSEADLAGPGASRGLRALMEFEVTRARALLDGGAPLVGTLRGWSRIAVSGYLAGGRAALGAIAAAGYDVLTGTPRPRKSRIAAGLARAVVTGR
jgi:squalene synthase HpnC